MMISFNYTPKASDNEPAYEEVYPSDVTPFFEHWKLILGDGSNVVHAIDYSHEDSFYRAKDIPPVQYLALTCSARTESFIQDV